MKRNMESATPDFFATEEERRFVRTMAGYGIAREDIARAIRGGLHQSELEAHFADALHEGQIEANANVAESLFNQAVGKTKIVEDGKIVETGTAPVASAAIFWLKTHGWPRSKGDGGGDISIGQAGRSFDPARLTTRELLRLEALLEKAIIKDTGLDKIRPTKRAKSK